MRMDDFDMMLGMKFLAGKDVIPIPSIGSLLIMGEKPAMVPAKVKQTTKLKLLSALQFKKGVKRQELTFVAVLGVYEQEGGEPIPPKIEGVLKKFGDVMPDQLPKILPSRREIDHQIELVSGSKSPARAPYGAPMLFQNATKHEMVPFCKALSPTVHSVIF